MTTSCKWADFASFQGPITSAYEECLALIDQMVSDSLTSRSHTWDDLIDDLFRIRLLEAGYDGQETPAPEKDLVDGAIRLAMELRDAGFAPAHYATAGVNGTIHFEWIGRNWSRGIEVISPNRAEWSEVTLSGDPPPIMIVGW